MVLVVFADGLGLGPADPRVNPTLDGSLWFLPSLLRSAAPVDACLGVDGLPQSATGQVALFTGLNAALALGHHQQGFPTPTLRKLLCQGTFYTRLAEAGGRAAFLNAFGRRYLRRLVQGARSRAGGAPASASTLAAVAAGVPLRDAADLRRGEAVYHDLTGDGLREQGEEAPRWGPEEAASAALRVAKDHDLTFFEFFQTDLAGHGGDREAALEVLRKLDRFLGELAAGLRSLAAAAAAAAVATDCAAGAAATVAAGTSASTASEAAVAAAARPAPGQGRGGGGDGCLVLVSDHGNVEDLSTRSHTRNPVPLAVWRPGEARGAATAPEPGACIRLTDVAGLLVTLALEGRTAHTGRAARRGEGRRPDGPEDPQDSAIRARPGGPR